MNIFKGSPEIEFKSQKSALARQSALLKEHLAYCAGNSPYYRRLFRKNGIRHQAIRLDNLANIPLTDKSDFSRHNDEFLAVPQPEIVDIVLSSGTTGKPSRIMYTERDLQRLAYNEQISFASCGVTAKDIALLTCTMDRCFIAGLAYFLGIRALGAAAIRNGHGTLSSHMDIIRSIKPTVLIGVPSFLRRLAHYLKDNGINPAKTSIGKLVCIGEPVRGQDMKPLKLGIDLEQLWNAKVFSTYASSECITTFCECTAQKGGHLHPDLAIIEILDEHNLPVPPGTPGEVVLTPLSIEGMPLVRFKTGDISFLITTPCSCGRKSPRLGPILGRKQQMMKVRGTSLYPPAVFAAMDEIPGIGDYYLEISTINELSDDLVIHIAARPKLPPLDALREKLQSRLRVTPTIVIDPEDEVRQRMYPPESRKPVRVIDRRLTR